MRKTKKEDAKQSGEGAATPLQSLRMFLLPDFQSLQNLLGFTRWGEFPSVGHFGFEMSQELIVGKGAGEGNAMVAFGPLDVVDVGTNEIGCHLGKPLIVIEEA